MRNTIIDLAPVPLRRYQKVMNRLDWRLLFVKRLHRNKIKQAKRVYALINQDDFTGSPARTFTYLRKIDPFVFEELLLIAFKYKGIKVIRNHAYTGDGGIDGTLVLKDKRKIAIQAKRYQSHINPAHVREFSEIVNKRFDGGLFIHTGKTGAKSYANLSSHLQLISGNKLIDLLKAT